MEQALKKASDAGYKKTYGYYPTRPNVTDDARLRNEILLDPKFWQALGKAEGKETTTAYCPCCGADRDWQGQKLFFWWQFQMHRFTDHLIAGKDINSFFEELLTSSK